MDKNHEMYYLFAYERDYLVEMGLFHLIYLSIFNFIINYCLQTIYIHILIVILVFYLPIYCNFIYIAYQDLSKNYFSYILLIFLGLILIISLIVFYNPSLSYSWIYVLIEFLIITGTELWIIYISISYIAEKKNIINFEFDNTTMNIYKNKIKNSVFSTNQIIKILYNYSYNVYSGEKILIRIELKDLRNITLKYNSLTSEVSDFLHFLEKYCHNYGIKIIIEKRDDRDKLKNEI